MVLERDTVNGLVGGVCAGLARGLGVDPLFVRLAFVVGVMCFGVGLLPYLVLWVLVPAAPVE